VTERGDAMGGCVHIGHASGPEPGPEAWRPVLDVGVEAASVSIFYSQPLTLSKNDV
jgi:ribulose 1,5-bisphosphate carboxylase large subunit-like protein